MRVEKRVLVMLVFCLGGLIVWIGVSNFTNGHHTPTQQAAEREAAIVQTMKVLAEARPHDFIELPQKRYAAVVRHSGSEDITIVLQTCLGCETQRRTVRQLAEVGVRLIPVGYTDEWSRIVRVWFNQNYQPTENF